MEQDNNIQFEPVSSVVKVFGILSGLSETQSIGVTELSKKLGASKSTVYRFLQTMKILGYVSQEGDTDKYALTLKLFELGSKSLEYVDLINSAERQMRRISEQKENPVKEALHLGVRDEDNFIYVHKIDSQYNLRIQSRIGGRNPLYCTAIGKVLLAEKDDQEVRDILKNSEFVPLTERTHTSLETLIKELSLVRDQGYGEDIEENEAGLRCIALPIYDRFNNVIAGMSISYPTLRYTEEKKQQYIEFLKESCELVSKEMGWNG